MMEDVLSGSMCQLASAESQLRPAGLSEHVTSKLIINHSINEKLCAHLQLPCPVV